MRLFDNLLLLSYLPALLAPFWRPTEGIGVRLAAALTPLAILSVQLAIEGPREDLRLCYAMVGIALLLSALSLIPRRPVAIGPGLGALADRADRLALTPAIPCAHRGRPAARRLLPADDPALPGRRADLPADARAGLGRRVRRAAQQR